jgi:hypothetical protein
METGSISIPIPFTPGDVEVEVVLSLEGQTIHQQIAHVDQYRLELKLQKLYPIYTFQAIAFLSVLEYSDSQKPEKILTQRITQLCFKRK